MTVNGDLIAKALSIGLGAWVQYERCCKRTEVLSESYLGYPISQILNSHTNSRVVSEFVHPVLDQERGRKTGRKPALDYVICDHKGAIKLAIEVKWLARSDIALEQVMWDLIRLELIRRRFDVPCMFILAGRKGKIDKFFERNRYAGRFGGPANQSILLHRKNTQNSLKLDSTIQCHRPVLKGLYREYQSTKFPSRLATTRVTPLIEERKNTDIQVYVWKLSNITDKSFFIPKNISRFHVNPIEMEHQK